MIFMCISCYAVRETKAIDKPSLTETVAQVSSLTRIYLNYPFLCGAGSNEETQNLFMKQKSLKKEIK